MIDINVLITGGVGLATSTISAIVSWILAKRKYNAEIDSTLIENMKESLDFYQKLSDDNRDRLEECLKRNDALEDEIKELRRQMYDVMYNICYNISCQHRKVTKDGDETNKKI